MNSERTQISPARPWLPPGTRLNGIYEIDQPIGMGGMGEIYKGHLVETNDPVAIKMMLPEMSANEAALTLFRKEASALHHIQHDAIVRYYVFTVEPQLLRPYLAMEFVDGRTLTDLLDQGPLSFEASLSLLHRVASGLHAAHERGVVHRDVSPDNIILPHDNLAHAKIIDFGIARTAQHGTVIGSGFAGKYSYVSPEQLGLFGGDVTPKSDIYSLGLVMAQALTGKAIDMGGSQVEIIEKRRKVPDLGAIDMRVRPLIEQMLEPDPAQRPESMAALAVWSPELAPSPGGSRGAATSGSGPTVGTGIPKGRGAAPCEIRGGGADVGHSASRGWRGGLLRCVSIRQTASHIRSGGQGLQFHIAVRNGSSGETRRGVGRRPDQIVRSAICWRQLLLPNTDRGQRPRSGA